MVLMANLNLAVMQFIFKNVALGLLNQGMAATVV
jgi:hypothetical protein